ncbi:MAG: endolytic transglycosylase MltG [Candidatus Pacebacteria bacterium]|nr:endolytic transglycosylase MltG [Candidatus Paceibacterota bacterium]
MNKKKIFLAFIIFIFSLVFIVMGSYFYIQDIIKKPYNIQDSAKQEFVIESGESVRQIANKLESESLILGRNYFEIYIWQEKLASRLQAGKYELSRSMTIGQMVNLFVGGEIVGNEISITIPEGYSVKDIDRTLAENNLINEGEFINFDENINQELLSKYGFLEDKPKGIGLQGYYFPDTYKYYNNSPIEDVVAKMLSNFDAKLTSDLRSEIKKQNKTIFEVIILASIVEKEAGNAKDMSKVASVFQNRLDIGKALESDATVNFITNSGRSQSTYEDLKVDSPYNTYKYKGLTPGPISNPGIDAIKATIYPSKTDYYYFLTEKENGKAIFSKTYQEHLMNKNKYLD